MAIRTEYKAPATHDVLTVSSVDLEGLETIHYIIDPTDSDMRENLSNRKIGASQYAREAKDFMARELQKRGVTRKLLIKKQTVYVSDSEVVA